MIRISFWNTYRSALVFFTVGMFFTNFADYSGRWGLNPLFWIVVFAGLSLPAIVQGVYRGRVPVPPLFWWGLFYMMLSVLWFYRSPQDAVAYQNVQTRVLSVLFLMLCLIVCNRPQEQLLARQAIAIGVLIATALNVYELFHPMTFSTIPGRSSGIYTNVNQSGAALVLGLILSYHVIPDRLKMIFVGITALGIIPTFSRSSMIGWMIVVGYFWMRAGLAAQFRRVFVFASLGMVAIYSPIWKNLQRNLEEKGVLNLNVLERVAFFTNGTQTDDSSNERKAVAKRAWELFGERPLLGWGTGANRRIEGFEVGTHNIYLAMLVDHGVLGFFVIPGLLLATLWGANRKTMDVAIPFTLFILIWGFFSHNVLEERYILLAVGLLASMVATYRVPRTAPALEPAASTALNQLPVPVA